MTDLPPDELRAVFGVDEATATEDLRGRSFASTVGVWRVRAGGDSAVLKVLRLGAAPLPHWPSEANEEDVFYWRREVHACTLLGGRHGLRQPRVRHVADRPDGGVALWFEDLGERPPWTVDDVVDVAARLGRLHAGEVPPRAPWLARGWFRRYVELRAHEAALGAPEVWARRREILRLVEDAPAVLAHNDLHPGNLFRAADDIAVVDWAFCGLGPAGGDAGILAADSLFDAYVAVADGEELIERVWDAYAAAVGPRLAREAHFVYFAGNILRYAWIVAPPPGHWPLGQADRYRTAYELLRAAAAERLPSLA